jgi:hypothetical protein
MRKIIAILFVLLGFFSCKTKQTKGVFHDQTIEPFDTVTVSSAVDSSMRNLVQTGLFNLERISNSFYFSKQFKKRFSHSILITDISDFRVSSFDVIKRTHDDEMLEWAGRRPFSEIEFLVVFGALFKMNQTGKVIFLTNRTPNIFHVRTTDGFSVAVDVWYQDGQWCFNARPLNSSWISGGRVFMRRKFDR